LGDLRRVGIESTGSYGADLLRFMQAVSSEVLEVITPDKHDRRRLGKNHDLDAPECRPRCLCQGRTVTPRSRDGMVVSLRVLTVCRKTAVAGFIDAFLLQARKAKPLNWLSVSAHDKSLSQPYIALISLRRSIFGRSHEGKI
jgi:hypothetical protein